MPCLAMFVDSHCHLSFPEFAARITEIRADMAAASVDKALCICTTLEEFEQVHTLATRYDNFWCSVGVHPDNEGVREPRVEDLGYPEKLTMIRPSSDQAPPS